LTGKSEEGQKFKSQHAFWTLRPIEIGVGGNKANGVWVVGVRGWGGGDDVRGCYDPVLVVGLNV